MAELGYIKVGNTKYKLGEDLTGIVVDGVLYPIQSGGGSTQAKTVLPTKSQQTVRPDSGYGSLSSVTVLPIPDNYQDVSGVSATAADVLTGKDIVTSSGTVHGSMPNIGSVTSTLDASTTRFNIGRGYHDGTGHVDIVTEEKSATPTESAQIIVPSTGKVLKKVSVSPIPQVYADSSSANLTVEDAPYLLEGYEAIAYNPETDAAEIISGEMIYNDVGEVTLYGGESYNIPEGYHDGTGVITAVGGGGTAFNAVFECPPYCHIYGTRDVAGTVSDVEWTVDDFTEYEVTLQKNATYVLYCDVDIPASTLAEGSTVTVHANRISFQTGETKEKYSFIPSGAVFFFGWENPAYTYRVANNSGYGTLTHFRYRTGTSSSSLGSIITDHPMTKDRFHHCYYSNTYDFSSTHAATFAYENPYDWTQDGHRVQSVWSMMCTRGWSWTGSTQIARLGFNSSINPSTTYEWNGEILFGGTARGGGTYYTQSNINGWGNRPQWSLRTVSAFETSDQRSRYMGWYFWKNFTSAAGRELDAFVFVFMDSDEPYTPPNV